MSNRIDLMCRVCLVKDSLSDMCPLADLPKREMLYECTSVWVETDDNYPQQLCKNCWDKCKNWAAFQALAKESDRELRRTSEKVAVNNYEGFSNVTEGLNEEERNNFDEVGENSMEMPEEKVYLEGYSLAPEGVTTPSLDNQGIEEETTIVKEEEVEEVYLEGYSLAPVEAYEEGEEETVSSGSIQEESRTATTEESPKRKKIPYKCGFCAKNIRTYTQWLIHISTHQDYKPFECDLCAKKFHNRSNLTSHKRMHSENRTFECVHCDKKFKRRDYLTAHQWVHVGVKKFECDQCKMKFQRKVWLARHMLTHSGIKPFECAQCPNKYRTRGELNKHKILHSKKRPYKCDWCGTKFKYNSSLNNHLKTKHQ